MKFVTPLTALVLCAVASLLPVSHAQDTDLFMTPPTDNSARPNILIILDNTANWSASADGGTKFDLEQEALASVVSGLPVDTFNIGLMMFSETGGDNGNPSGGYVRYAIREMDDTNKDDLVELIETLDQNGDKGNGAENALAMHEAYLYFQALEARSGHNKDKHDPAAFDTNPEYQTPVTEACAKNYIIFISNGAPSNGENSTASDLLDDLDAKLDSDPIALSPSGKQSNWGDEYARFMANNNINTYTIDVNPLTNGQGPDNTALLKSMARQGQGEYYKVVTGEELEEAFTETLDEIQAVNSVFAATALPVSVNVRGTYLNEVYMAVFRPDASASPRWLGNLKTFQLAVDSSTGSLFLADANGSAAQSPITGFIRSTATSFWSENSSYWTYAPSGTPPSASDAPDGEIVEKGGSAQQQRNDWPTRNLYTCTSGCDAGDLLSGTVFGTGNTNITTGALGVVDADARALLIDWVRGEDNLSPAERTTGEVRPSLHGDVVHSRPAVVNYNRDGNDNDIAVFYGANDGVFRAIRGGKNVATGGSELWGFVAPEFFGKLNRLRDNTPAINVPSDPSDPDGNKPYFADGSVSIYTKDVNTDGRIIAADADKAYIYVTMRRGGRFMYAFDVSAPELPKLLWKRSNTDTDYAEMGQTWSEAKVATINLGGTPTPVLIMGAGYDPTAEDTSPAGTASMGRGVLVINALTGSVIWQAGTGSGLAHSVASDVTVIDRNSDGYADRVYVVDTGANVWRLDIGDTDTANWLVNKLASLGGSGANARKLMFPADVVYTRDATGPYDALLIGSGDREKPFSTSVTNHFFMLKDRHVYTTGAGQDTIILDVDDADNNDLYDATANLIQDGTSDQQIAAQAALLAAKGWYITMRSGEKVVGSAVSIAGTVFFSTNQPAPADPSSCASNLGIARIYAVDYKNATATLNFDGLGDLTKTDRDNEVPGGGYLPSPTAVITEIYDDDDDDGEPDEGSGKKYQTVCFGPTCVKPPNVVFEARRRVFWHKSID